MSDYRDGSTPRYERPDRAPDEHAREDRPSASGESRECWLSPLPRVPERRAGKIRYAKYAEVFLPIFYEGLRQKSQVPWSFQNTSITSVLAVVEKSVFWAIHANARNTRYHNLQGSLSLQRIGCTGKAVIQTGQDWISRLDRGVLSCCGGVIVEFFV